MYSKTYLIINRNMLLTCHVMIYYIFVKLLFVSPSTLTHFSFANKPTTGNLIKDKYTCKIGIQIYLNTKTECSESGTSLIHHCGHGGHLTGKLREHHCSICFVTRHFCIALMPHGYIALLHC